MFDEEMKKVKKNSHALCKHCNKAILVEFEKDYRNLVKHCMSLGDEIMYCSFQLALKIKICKFTSP